MTAGSRYLLTISIALAALLGLSLCGYKYWESEPQQTGLMDYILSSAESQPATLPPCMDEPTREQIRAVMLTALDTALQHHIENAFAVWMRDDRSQPERARTGVVQGMRAYMLARKSTLEWVPPPCAG